MIVNEDRFFLSHRKEIAVEALKADFDVTIVCKDTGRMDEVKALGLKTLDLPINPTGTHLREEWKTYRFPTPPYRQGDPMPIHQRLWRRPKEICLCPRSRR